MKYIVSIILLCLVGCEDKVIEPTTKYVTTPTICPPSHPETEPSQFSFAGAKEVKNITKTSATISWDHIEGISSYHIISITKTDRKILNTVIAPNQEIKLTGLMPDTNYQILVRAIDQRGHIDINTEILSFDTLPWPNYTNQKAIQLNGSQSISLGATDTFNFDKEFTMSFWFKIASQSRNDIRFLTLHKGDFAGSALSIGVKRGSVNLYLLNQNDELKKHSKEFNYYDNDWHQMTLIYNKKNIVVFIDGVKLIQRKFQFTNLGSHPVFIGSYTGIQKAALAKFDELAIFKSSFTNREVQEIYNSGIATDLRTLSQANNLVHWYQLGDHASDSTSSIEDVISGKTANPLNFDETSFILDSP